MRLNQWATQAACLSVLSLFLISCVSENAPFIEGRISPYFKGPEEMAYCSSQITYDNTVTITGTARYFARQTYAGGLGNATASPIRRAEIRVTDAKGSVIQCGETDNLGKFSIELPAGPTSYTLAINSRAFNSHLKASVLDRPERGLFYTLSTSVTPAEDLNIGTLSARADDDSVLGAAFNILDQLLKANEFLRAKVSSCPFADCSDFDVADKVSVYWEKGYNPGDYFDLTSGLSFYLPTFSRLFILGGISGDIDSSDTDHFDNSVIIHEYGHFLEDILSKSDSPGGSHSGNSVIDPRLAFGEGWANFFQAAVRDDPTYIDTTGNIDGTTDYIFNIPLEDVAAGCGAAPSTPGCDEPANAGEGNFREFSISRMLWDINDTSAGDTATDNVDDNFLEIWTSLTKSTGFSSPSFAFRSIGLLHEVQTNLVGATDWSTIQTAHDHQPDRSDYGDPVTTGATCSFNFNIDPAVIAGDGGSFATSHLLLNNDFYYMKHKGGSITLTLNYTTPAGTEADLDLYLYNESAVFGTAEDIVGSSKEEPDGTVADTETETITVANLPAGNYLINIFAYTGGGGGGANSTNYELKKDGADLCP